MVDDSHLFRRRRQSGWTAALLLLWWWCCELCSAAAVDDYMKRKEMMGVMDNPLDNLPGWVSWYNWGAEGAPLLNVEAVEGIKRFAMEAFQQMGDAYSQYLGRSSLSSSQHVLLHLHLHIRARQQCVGTLKGQIQSRLVLTKQCPIYYYFEFTKCSVFILVVDRNKENNPIFVNTHFMDGVLSFLPVTKADDTILLLE